MAKLSGYRKLIKWIRVGDDFIKASTETRAESVVMPDGTILADKNGVSNNSSKEGLNTVAGLKGFYYKAVDKTNKIIYLTKERLYDGNYYFQSFDAKPTLDGWTSNGSTAPEVSGKGLLLKNNKAIVYQNIDVEPNKTYELAGSFMLPSGGINKLSYQGYKEDGTTTTTTKSTADNSDKFGTYLIHSNLSIYACDKDFTYTDMNGKEVDATNLTANTLYQFACKVTTDANTKVLRLYLSGHSGNSYFDNISLCEVGDVNAPNLVLNGDFEEAPSFSIETDLYYSENAVGKLLSVCNNTKFENSLKITEVARGKIYYELAKEDIDPFEVQNQMTNVNVDDFSVWCHDCNDEGIVDLGFGSFATGDSTRATNRGALSSGRDNRSYGQYSSTTGRDNTAGYCAHAGGRHNNAPGDYSNVGGGYQNSAIGKCSQAGGKYTQARGDYSSTEGLNTVASSEYQHVQGKFNIADSKGKYAHIVGNGISDEERSNAHTLDWDGNAWFAGDVTAKGCGGTNPVSLVDVNARKLEKSAFTFDAETGTLTLTL